MPLLGAIAGCHCEKAIAGCHCEKKLARVIHHSPLHLSLHCDNTNWLVLCGVYAGIILWTSAAIIYGQCSPPDPNHPRVPRASVETDTKKTRQAGTVEKKNVETKRLPPLTATLLPRTSRRKNTRRRQKLTKKTTHAKTPNAPPSSLFLKGCLLSLPHCFQEHHEEKTQEEDNNDSKKTTHAKTPHASGGRRCALPPTPLQPVFSKVASSHCHIASKNITKKKHKKKTKNNKKTTHAKTPMHLAGRRCALPTKNDTKKHTNAKTPNASFEEHYRKKQQMQKHPMHLGGRRLSLTHHEENKRE